MKILYLVTNFYLIGGKERYDKNLIQALNEIGIATRIVMLKGRGFLEKAWFVVQAASQCIGKRWDFVFCAHFPFSPLCLFLNKVFSLKYVVIAHGIEAWNIKDKWQKKALKSASFIIVVSHYTKEKIIGQLPKMEERIFMLPNSIDGDFFLIKEKPKSLIQKLKIDDAKVILTVSRLYPKEREKGYYKVIEALPLVKEKIPSLKYIIVGGGLNGFGDARNEVAAYAQKNGVAHDVILPGFVSDNELVDYYNLCDVFVMPSKQEGFGIVFLEALACGKPAVVGNKDASREAIINGELGFLVDPDNTVEIAEAITSVLTKNTPKRFLNREFLRKRVLKEYGIGEFKEKVKFLKDFLINGLPR